MKIETHRGDLLNDAIEIVGKFPSAGGANIVYDIVVKDVPYQYINPSVKLKFQDGNPNECINGISNEALLAVLIDRLSSFQSGKFACTENQVALEGCLSAMGALKSRTASRVEKGIEGTQEI